MVEVVMWVLLVLVRLIRWWVALVFGVAMRVWAWIWRRPWSSAKKLVLLFAPHAFATIVLLAFMTASASRPGGAPDLQPGARRALHEFLSPWAYSAAPAQSVAAGKRRGAGAPRGVVYRSGGELLLRNVGFLVGSLYGVPFLISFLFFGPLWVLVARSKELRTPRGTIAGLPVTLGAITRFSKLFPKWRTEADRNRAWFAGASATGRGPLLIGTDARITHTWVVGATGTGKTQGVLLPMLRSDIVAGRAVVFIDGKGDRETIAAVWHLAKQAGRDADFRYFDLRSPERSDSYSPLLSGTPNEQCDRIMAALRWDNEYYRSQSQSVLLDVLRALATAGHPYTLDDVLVALSDIHALGALGELVAEEHRMELGAIAARWKEYQLETSGLRAQLKVLLTSDYGDLLKASAPTLDLAEAYRARQIVYFALPVARYPETAPLVAKLIIGDLNGVAGRVQDGELAKNPTALVVDEFASFAMPTFVDLLNKARSAGMAITIAHQSMRGDLAGAGEGYADRVADNTNIKICLRQSEDAEYVAGLSGTYRTTKQTDQLQDSLFGQERTGLGSVREVDEYVVSPNVIRELPPGWAVVKINQPSSYVDLVALDYVATAGLPPYTPPLRETQAGLGIDLRRRASIHSRPALPHRDEASTLRFEGA